MQNNPDVEAVSSAREAIRADPEDAVAHALLALGLVQTTEAGGIGATSEAVAEARRAVGIAPDLALAHYALGVALAAHGGAPHADEVVRSLTTALQLDPTFEPARLAVVELIKRGSASYRLALDLTFWVQSLQPGARWMVIIGLFVAFRIVRSVLDAHPQWAPVLVPLLATYILFVITSWIGVPVSNLVLRAHPVGRSLLSPAERLASNLVGASLAIAAVAGLIYWATSAHVAVAVALVSLGMTIPVSAAFDAYGTGAWSALSRYARALATIGVVAIVLSITGGIDAARPALGIFGLGIVAFSWVSHFLFAKHQ